MASFKVKVDDNQWDVSAEDLAALDIQIGTEGSYHIVKDNKGYSIQLVHIDKTSKTVELKVNGNLHTVHLQDEQDVLVEQLGFLSVASQKSSDVKAPMPGLILDVMVEAGQEVSEGDALIILEAMKMENMIKASADGIIKSIEISKGDTVDKNQLLIELE